MVRIEGGNGSCQDDAIIITDCNNIEGVGQEITEIKRRFGQYKLLKQSLLKIDNRMYDMLTLNINGKEETVYFDITNFFGKF
ncbi:MAG: hypothetical protein ACQERB_03195 [Promethearchaeati archaeon]